MFLVTTADQRFWNADEKILFLGEWCKTYKDKSIWKKLDSKTLPYHWDDRQRLYRDYIYAKSLYEKHLPLISEQLNHLHGIKQSTRYWRIIVGPWLHYFIEILYDRYLSIQTAIQSDLVTKTRIVLPERESCIPPDFNSFHQAFSGESYNAYLYSKIIDFCKNIPCEQKFFDLEMPWQTSFPPIFSAKTMLKKWGGRFFSLIPSRFNRHVFVASYFGMIDLIRLQLSLGQIPYLRAPEIDVENIVTDFYLRDQLKYSVSGDDFERLLCEVIPYQIPKVYVESFSHLRDQALKSFPQKPSSIFTANAHAGNEAFKTWAAHYVDKGTKLVLSQHGGHYGTGLWNSEEDHEVSIADHYYTWGWTSQNPKVTAMPSGKLLRASRELKPNPRGKILWVVMSVPRHAYFMYSIPVGPQMESYFEDQFRLAQAMTPTIQSNVLVRLHPCDFGWEQKKRWEERCSTLALDDGQIPFYQQLNQSRLLISTYNATTYLETFVANFPTVLFWNPKHWEIRDEALPYFDRLKEVGILFDDAQKAAAHIDNIYPDPQGWWSRTEVQAAKNEFCRRFASVHEDWLPKLKKELEVYPYLKEEN